MRDDPLISYRYLAGGRVVEAQCSSAALRIEDGIAEPLTPEDTAIYERYRVSTEETAEPEPVEFPAPEEFREAEIIPLRPESEAPEAGVDPEQAKELNPDVDWPAGHTFKRSGAWVAVFDPDGDEVRSTTPAGMWRMEAGRKAAWHDLEA